MPVILTPELQKIWLDPKAGFKDIYRKIYKEKPTDMLGYYKVADVVNKIKNDNEDCIMELEKYKKKMHSRGLGRFFGYAKKDKEENMKELEDSKEGDGDKTPKKDNKNSEKEISSNSQEEKKDEEKGKSSQVNKSKEQKEVNSKDKKEGPKKVIEESENKESSITQKEEKKEVNDTQATKTTYPSTITQGITQVESGLSSVKINDDKEEKPSEEPASEDKGIPLRLHYGKVQKKNKKFMSKKEVEKVEERQLRRSKRRKVQTNKIDQDNTMVKIPKRKK